MKIAIGVDHAGYDLKSIIIQHLTACGHEVIDCGVDSEDPSDYPDFAHKVATLISEHQVDRGVLICGSGVGMAMAANRHSGVRAFVGYDPDITRVACQHNHANAICFGSRVTSVDMMKKCLDVFFATEYEGGRHERRVQKIEGGKK